MACLTIINGDRKLSCGAPPSGMTSPVSAKLINASHIESFALTGNTATITRKAGTAAASALETANNSLVVNVALKGGEVYPQQNDISIEATLWDQAVLNTADGRAATGGANGQYVIAVDHGGGFLRVYGLGAPLEVLSVEGSSNGNGQLRTTFGVEDWQVGTTAYLITKADYDALSTAVPAGGGGEVIP